MKFRYLKINGSSIRGENTLTKEMLGMVANGLYDTIIDLEEMRYFDADDNEWKDVGGTLL